MMIFDFGWKRKANGGVSAESGADEGGANLGIERSCFPLAVGSSVFKQSP
jgi:hypothetical protein